MQAIDLPAYSFPAIHRARDVTAEAVVQAADFASKAKRARGARLLSSPERQGRGCLLTAMFCTCLAVDQGVSPEVVARAILNEHKAAMAYGACLRLSCSGRADQGLPCLLQLVDLDCASMHACSTTGKMDSAAILEALEGLKTQLKTGLQGLEEKLQEGLGSLRTDLKQELQDGLQDVKQELSTGLAILAYNSQARAANAAGSARDFKLVPFKKQSTGGQQPVGALPASPPFPATVGEMWSLTHKQIDELAAFYAEDFGTQDALLEERCKKVAFSLGARL